MFSIAMKGTSYPHPIRRNASAEQDQRGHWISAAAQLKCAPSPGAAIGREHLGTMSILSMIPPAVSPRRHAAARHALSLAFGLAAALALAGCANRTEMPTALGTPASQGQAQAQAQTQAADAKVEVPLDEHQASARCWMKYDSAHMSLEQKSQAVDKCIDQVMRAQRR